VHKQVIFILLSHGKMTDQLHKLSVINNVSNLKIEDPLHVILLDKEQFMIITL